MRALAMVLGGGDPGEQVIVLPTVITQAQLNDGNITNMEELAAQLPAFAHADVAAPEWMPLPSAPQ